MTRLSVARTGVAAVVAAVLGATAGYWVAQRNAAEREVQNRDLITAVRANELGNRMAMLRLMRNGQATVEDIESIEISAILLLDSLSFDEVTDSYQSYGVLKRVGQTLGTYMHDFPKSQFAEPRFTTVPKLLAVRARQ